MTEGGRLRRTVVATLSSQAALEDGIVKSVNKEMSGKEVIYALWIHPDTT